MYLEMVQLVHRISLPACKVTQSIPLEKSEETVPLHHYLARSFVLDRSCWSHKISANE